MLLVIFILINQSLFCDWLDIGYKVEKINENKIKIYGVSSYDGGLDTSTKEIKLESGDTIRIKVKIYEVLPYGMHIVDGAFYVWYNKKKIINEAKFACSSNNFSSIEIIIDDKGYEIKKYDDALSTFDWYTDNKEKIELNKVEKVLKDNFNMEIDYDEYPTTEKDRPVGKIIVLVNNDEKLYNDFFKENIEKGILNFNFKEIEGHSVKYPELIEKYKYKYLGGIGKYKYDINNDNKEETVIVFSPRTHASDEDTYIVFNKKDVFLDKEKIQEERDISKLVEESDYIFPNSFKISNEEKYELKWEKHKISLMVGYTYYSPVIIDGVTYFYMNPISQEINNWRGLYKIEEGQVKEVLIYYKVRENY